MRVGQAVLILAVLSLAVGCHRTPDSDLDKLPPPVNAAPVLAVTHDSAVTAGEALGRIGKPAVPELSDALTDPNPRVRVRACRALAAMGAVGQEAVPALIRALSDSEDVVRDEAARALGQIGEPAAPAVPSLIEMMRGK